MRESTKNRKISTGRLQLSQAAEMLTAVNSLWGNWGKSNTDIWGYPLKQLDCQAFLGKTFILVKETKDQHSFEDCPLHKRSSLKQIIISSTITVLETQIYLIQWDWYIREQFEHNVNFAFGYAWFHLWESPDECTKFLHPSRVGICT